MAATLTAPAASAYTVPDDWVETNSRLFKTTPPGFDQVETNSMAANRASTPQVVERELPKGRGELMASLLWQYCGGSTRQVHGLYAGVGAAEVTDESSMGNIDLPTGPQPADYYRTVKNHGNILVTFISTARRKSGFIPTLSSHRFTEEQAKEYTRKFEAWMQELDSYSPYIHYIRSVHITKANNSTDCNLILKGISEFVLEVTGVEGHLAKALTARITSLVKSLANFVTHSGTAVHAGFTLETTETSGAENPIQPICFTSTFMSKTKSGKSTSESSEITLAAFIYQLNSDAIISKAEHLARGSTLSGSKQYRAYVNAPLKDY